MKERIDSIKTSALQAIAEAEGSAALNDVRVRKLLGTVSKEERPAMGKALNDVRVEIETALDAKIAEAAEREKQMRLKAEAVDVTLPGRAVKAGTLHPLTQVREDILKVFLGMGFSVAEGPEIESDLFNFQLLNVPKDHPARDMQDTFYVNENIVLRTHTSPMQARISTSTKISCCVRILRLCRRVL